jgi:hypothetical protein
MSIKIKMKKVFNHIRIRMNKMNKNNNKNNNKVCITINKLNFM